MAKRVIERSSVAIMVSSGLVYVTVDGMIKLKLSRDAPEAAVYESVQPGQRLRVLDHDYIATWTAPTDGDIWVRLVSELSA